MLLDTPKCFWIPPKRETGNPKRETENGKPWWGNRRGASAEIVVGNRGRLDGNRGGETVEELILKHSGVA